ncbi:Tolloid-like protein 1 [Elysia marginata]|uniref:Tolloid-like protein 1 n=1 Tax=Elysia marginata TaxID=1093978 RepID=A0AAV4JVI3_9GAST|nr:Tolloid-like protein 1 [Elysia marginata]
MEVAGRACGGNLRTNAGSLKSPNFPGSFPDGTRCTWVITTDPGTRVSLKFFEFETEQCSSCGCDGLIIRDGKSQSATLLSKLCGSDLPSPVIASSNVMYLEFFSDSSNTGKGFKAEWSLGRIFKKIITFSCCIVGMTLLQLYILQKKRKKMSFKVS